MAIPMDQITSMPAFSPYYPPPPVRYRNARFQFVFFRADPAAVDRVLPACLEPAEDGYCVAIGITVPWASSYGAFDESVLSVKCTFKGETGVFCPGGLSEFPFQHPGRTGNLRHAQGVCGIRVRHG